MFDILGVVDKHVSASNHWTLEKHSFTVPPFRACVAPDLAVILSSEIVEEGTMETFRISRLILGPRDLSQRIGSGRAIHLGRF